MSGALSENRVAAEMQWTLGKIRIISILVALISVFTTSGVARAIDSPDTNIELAYLKQLHEKSGSVNPQLTAILLGTIINAQKTNEGIAFFSKLASTAKGKDATRYKAATAVLRASHANSIFLLKRREWVRDTIDLFDSVREEDPDNLLIRWLVGTTLAQIPVEFGQQANALRDLLWLEARFSEIPKDGLGPGTEREVLYQLARIYRDQGNEISAKNYLDRSGYKKFERDITLVSQFAANASDGLTLGVKEVREVVPGRVFLASGFEMMDFYFIVSDDGEQTISIDAGTRPESAELAHRAVLERFPGLPPIKTVLVTHTHWDHVGGHTYFRKLNRGVSFISRSNYAEQLDVIRTAVPHFKYFFSEFYTNDNISQYLPDQTLFGDNILDIGGTRIEAFAIDGGETEDAMIYRLPGLGVTFVGDFIMPFIGAPFANEGSASCLISAIAKLTAINPGMLLHGHKPLTDIFNAMEMLVDLSESLQWLKEKANSARLRTLSLAEIHQLNLIPDSIYGKPQLQLPYLVIREGFINRLYRESTGYWQTNLDGMDFLSHQDLGKLLKDELGINAKKLEGAMASLINRGHYDEALTLARWSEDVYPESENWRQARKQALAGLRAKYQYTNPFKFLIYSEVMGEGIPQLHLGHIHR